jgi:hypothetical protein
MLLKKTANTIAPKAVLKVIKLLKAVVTEAVAVKM